MSILYSFVKASFNGLVILGASSHGSNNMIWPLSWSLCIIGQIERNLAPFSRIPSLSNLIASWIELSLYIDYHSIHLYEWCWWMLKFLSPKPPIQGVRFHKTLLLNWIWLPFLTYTIHLSITLEQLILSLILWPIIYNTIASSFF